MDPATCKGGEKRSYEKVEVHIDSHFKKKRVSQPALSVRVQKIRDFMEEWIDLRAKDGATDQPAIQRFYI